MDDMEAIKTAVTQIPGTDGIKVLSAMVEPVGGALPGVSRPASYLAKELDRVPDGSYVILLEKRSHPDSWSVVVQSAQLVEKLEIPRESV